MIGKMMKMASCAGSRSPGWGGIGIVTKVYVGGARLYGRSGESV